MDRDAQTLLALFERAGDWRSFLHDLPLYNHDTTLQEVTKVFEGAVSQLWYDKVNSIAALQVRLYIADSLPYPFLVLLEATRRAIGIPAPFYIDIVTGLIHAVLHKHTYVKMGRWKSKSRHWWVGTDNVGEGKSISMKSLVDTMVSALAECSAHACGVESDRFHVQQYGTTAAAIDKLRSADGYLCIYCPDAGRCLCMAAASGGKTDPHEFINLECFLDAAHGDEFNHSTKLDRQKAMKLPKKNPVDPVPSMPTLHIDPTNVTVLFLQQDLYFQKYWARIAREHSVGLPQRCLLAFGGDMDPAPKKWFNLLDEVCLPLIKQLFKDVIRSVGPKITRCETPVFHTSALQDEVVADLELRVKLYQRRAGTPPELKEAFPKSLYWLGTACLSNHLIAAFWRHAVRSSTHCPAIPGQISDDTFVAAVHFMFRRYLAGQSVLAVTAREAAWASRDIPSEVNPADLTQVLVRIVRGCAGAVIRQEHIEMLDLELKIGLSQVGTLVWQQAQHKLEALWQGLEDIGVGKVVTPLQGPTFFKKYKYTAVSQHVLNWLREHRIPSYIFGLMPHAAPQPVPTRYVTSVPKPRAVHHHAGPNPPSLPTASKSANYRGTQHIGDAVLAPMGSHPTGLGPKASMSPHSHSQYRQLGPSTYAPSSGHSGEELSGQGHRAPIANAVWGMASDNVIAQVAGLHDNLAPDTPCIETLQVGGYHSWERSR